MKKDWKDAELLVYNILKNQKNVYFNNTDKKYSTLLNEEELTLNHKDFQSIYPVGATFKSRLLRGDITLINKNGSKTIYDIKNYTKNRSNWGSSKIDNTFVKTIDSNFDYAIQIFPEYIAKNFLLKNHTLGFLTKIEFIDWFMKYECSFFYKPLKINKKYIVKVDNNQISYYKIDFSNLSNSKIKIIMFTDEKGYKFIQFLSDDVLIYEISQRKNGKSNCSFLSSSFLVMEKSSIKMPKRYTSDIIGLIIKHKTLSKEQICQKIISNYKVFFDKQKLSTKLIRNRILKDLNPSFQKLCKQNNIIYNEDQRSYHLI